MKDIRPVYNELIPFKSFSSSCDIKPSAAYVAVGSSYIIGFCIYFVGEESCLCMILMLRVLISSAVVLVRMYLPPQTFVYVL